MAIKNDKIGGTNYSTPTARIKPTDLNDTNNAILNQNIQVSELAVRLLQSNNVFINGPNIVVDKMTDSNGTNNTINTTDTNCEYDSVNDLYELPTGFTNPFVIIEATSISGSWEINDCKIIQIGTGKWQLTCTVGTEEERRAKIYKTLFYGVSISAHRANSTYITGLTALKTSVSRDVGKQAHYAELQAFESGSEGNTGFYTGTFSNTTDNTSCSSWSLVSVTSGVNSGKAYWEIPSGTVRNSRVDSDGTTDEIGTDTTSDEVNNPTNCQLQVQPYIFPDDFAIVRTIILCKGDISWVYTESGAIVETYSNIDFLTDNSIPVFTATTEDIAYQVTADTNTTALTGDELGFAISVPDSDIPTDTSITATISDGTNSLSPVTIDTTSKGAVVGNPSTLSSGNLKCTFTLATTDTAKTPTLKNYGINILR